MQAVSSSREQILQQVDRVSASSRFARSERLRRFLRYVVEQRLDGAPDGLKEYAIGVAVFDRDDTYDTRLDPIVRVEASRLRSKLREYYDTEGHDDSIRIDFEKGSYAPVITIREPAPLPEPAPVAVAPPPAVETPPEKSFPRWAAVLAFCAVLLWAITAQVLLLREAKPPSPDRWTPVWGAFLEPGATNHLVFGSPIFFMDPSTQFFHRYIRVNDAASLHENAAFDLMRKRLGDLVGPRYDYIETGDAISMQRITAFFGQFGSGLKAISAREASWDGLKEGNILFIGSDRMHPLLAKLPARYDFRFDGDYKVLNSSPLPGEPAFWKPKLDTALYAIVSRVAGLRPGRDVLIVTSHSGPGTAGAVDYLLRAEAADLLAQKLQGATRAPFQAVLRVLVDKGTPVQTELVAFHPLTGK